MKISFTYFAFLFSIFSISSAFSQYTTTIASGRPGNANGAGTVGKGILQFQAGIQISGNAYEDSIARKETDFSENLVIRYGLSEQLEISAVINQSNISYVNGIDNFSESGFNTTMLRARVKVIDNLAVQVGLNVPILRNDFDNDFSSPQLKVMYNTIFNENMSLTTNFGAQWGKVSDNPDGFYVFSFSGTLPANFSLILESYGTFNTTGVQNYFDAGLAYLVNPDFLLDLNAGRGKNYNVESYFVTIGFSYRLVTGYRNNK